SAYSTGGGGVFIGDPCLGGSSPADGFTNGGPAPSCSPIIIDTTGEGFHLTSAVDGVWFDIRGNGHPVHIAWTAEWSRNAFLALDYKESRRTDEFGNQFQFRAKVNPGDRKDQTEPPVARWAYDVFLATD